MISSESHNRKRRSATPRGGATPRHSAPAPRHGSLPTPAGRSRGAKPAPARSLGGSRPRGSARTAGGRLSTPNQKPKASVDRRTLVKGAVGLGAVGVVASALSSLQGCSTSGDDEAGAAAPTVVDERSATSITDSYTYVDAAPGIAAAGSWTLPLGTVLSPAEGDWIPATATGDSANPVVSASAFTVSGGKLVTVVDKPVSDGSNYVIFEARCSDSVYAWVELDVVSNDWALYGAPFSGGALSGAPTTLYTGNQDWDTPLIACSGTSVVWLVMPTANGAKSAEDSTCYLWKTGQKEAKAVVTSHGRFATEPTVSDGLVTLTPRVRGDEGVYYGITSYKLSDDLATQEDQLVLPLSVKPFSAVSMGGRFVFQIEANYSSGGLLGKMGTYISTGGDKFVTLSREPSAPPAGKGDLFLIKSRASYLVCDVASKTYGTLVAANRSVDYGEYPARVGTCSTFVTFATVKDPSTSYPGSVVVRAYTLGSSAPASKEGADGQGADDQGQQDQGQQV